MSDCTNKNKCLVASCRKEPAVNCRGLCLVCYSTAKKKVAAGQTTWEGLASMGLASEEPDVFTREFESKRGKHNDASCQ